MTAIQPLHHTQPNTAGHLPPETLVELIDTLARRWPDSVAAIDEAGQITYNALNTRSGMLARAISAGGIKRNDRIGLLCGNAIDWLLVLFAGAKAGATVVPFSTWSTRAELEFLVSDSKARLFFVGNKAEARDFLEDFQALTLPGRSSVVSLGRAGSSPFQALDDFMEGHASAPVPRPAGPGDDAMILYTSGSTSHPKAVRLTQAGMVENGYHIGARMGLRHGDRVFVPVPLFWAYGGCNALPAAMTHGATLVLPTRFEPSHALDMISQLDCTAIYTLPSITKALLDLPAFSVERTRTLRTGLTIGSPGEFLQACENLRVPEICNIYGATETYGNCAVTWHHWSKERRSVCQGPQLPGQTIRIRDRATGRILPQGCTGLVEVAGRITPGYAGQSREQNEAAFTEDGYYRTGDVGYLTDEGDFVFVGRVSEMIKKGGINISPIEIEDVLKRHAKVADAAVTGVSDDTHGERVVAFVVSADTTLTPDDLDAECRATLSKYKVPDRIELVTDLPLTATGKLHRGELRKRAESLPSLEKETP